MDHGDILLTLAEVSVAFAGFSGVVAVFGRRDPGTWSFADRFRFFSLVHASLFSLLLCIMPFGLLALNVAAGATFGPFLAALIFLIVLCSFLFARMLVAAFGAGRAA